MKSIPKKRKKGTIEDQINRVMNDPFLLSINLKNIEDAEERCLPITARSEKIVLEIGSAGGVTKKLRPNWQTSDIRACSGVDRVFSAECIPAENNSIDLVFAQDVLHHIPDLHRFSEEIFRVLRPGGAIYFREPYWGPVAKIVWKLFHPEDFSVNSLKLKQEYRSAMHGNQALAYALLTNKRQDIVNCFKSFEIRNYGPKLGLAFLLSGGATFTTCVSRSFLFKVLAFENRFPAIMRLTGFACSFSLHKPLEIQSSTF